MTKYRHVGSRIPAQWYYLLESKADELLPPLDRVGPKKRFSEIVRLAIAEFAEKRNIKLEQMK